MNSFLDFGWASALLFIFMGAVFFLLCRFERSKFFLVACLVFISFGFGQLRYQASDKSGDQTAFESKIGQDVSLSGVVSDEPERKEDYARFVLNSGKTKILIYAQKYPRYEYGDKLKISGLLKKPENFSEDFSWRDYLAKGGIYYEIFYPRIEFVSGGNGNFVKQKLFYIKNKFLSAISSAVPEPHASFLGGITIGAKDGLPKNLQEEFRTTGMAHVVALSGYNITIVAGTIMTVLSFLPRYFAVSGGVAGVILFAIMTGGSATVLRASIMALLALFAKTSGRIYTASWALFVAGFFMILQNPKILRFDASFQLSFMATLGLIYLSPIAENWFKFVPQKFKLKEMTIATVSAQIFVLPLLVYKTGVFSVVSLPVNFLILPFIPLTMFFGFTTGVSGMISGVLSAPFGWVSYILTQYELWIVGVFSKLPFASVTIQNFSLAFLFLAYVVLGFFIVIARFQKKVTDD